MSDTMLHTKLYMPPLRPVQVPRPRLIDQLNAGWYGKATIVFGPVGFGKTTLVRAWLHQLAGEQGGGGAEEQNFSPVPLPLRTSARFAWLSLDENDNDLQQFLTYLILALQTIDEQLGETALSLLDTLQSVDAQQGLTLVLNDVTTW